MKYKKGDPDCLGEDEAKNGNYNKDFMFIKKIDLHRAFQDGAFTDGLRVEDYPI